MKDPQELLEQFYSEADPTQREKLLEEYRAAVSRENPDFGDEFPGAGEVMDYSLYGTPVEYIDRLFTHRFKSKGKAVGEADLYLKYLMDLLFLSHSNTLFRRSRIREITGIIRDMEQDGRVHTDPDYEEAFYREIRNVVKRYIITCESASYGRKLMGMIAVEKEEKLEKMRADLQDLSVGLAREYGLEQEMRLFCKAVNDEYRDAVHGAEPLM